MVIKINPLTGKPDLTVGANDDLRVKTLETTGTGTSEFYGDVIIDGTLSCQSIPFRGVLSSAPSSAQQGWQYVNSGDNTLYIYYGNTWQALHVLTPAAVEYLLTEGGDYLLLETGDKIIKE